jgi:hypothetical protein
MAILSRRTALVCAGLVLCQVFVPAAVQAQGVSFIARRDFEAGYGPLSAAVGDFNGDGVPDLAVGNENSNNVSVLLGNGDGSFQAAWNFFAGAGPKSVVVGDFNVDKLPDLAVVNPNSATAGSVLINNTPR